MEVAVPVNPMDFDFGSSPYASAPTTPKRMGGEYYFSAPSSPTRLTEFYREFDELLIAATDGGQPDNSLPTVPFSWEEKPGTPKSLNKGFNKSSFEDDFAFDVSRELDTDSVSAEDLFDGGMIKPLKPTTGLQETRTETETTTMGERQIRGRERGASSVLTSSRSRRTRSMSPLRGNSDYQWQEDRKQRSTKPPVSSTCTTLSTSSSKGSRKWSFKDLLLFRSASDGRAMDKDPLKKYSAIFRKHDEDFRNSSLRSIEYHGSGSGSGSGSRRRGRVSAHELHYTVNRAVSNDMKKKTFLPYKQGILGRLAFNPTVHALANGFGFSHKH